MFKSMEAYLMVEEELLQKWAGIWGQLGRAGADRGPLGALRMKIVLTTSEQAIRAYNVWRFRSQKGNVGLSPRLRGSIVTLLQMGGTYVRQRTPRRERADQCG